jgi:hypothetical protein
MGMMFENRALVYRLQRLNGAVTLIGVTNTPDRDGKFVLIRHEQGLLTDIERYASIDRCDSHLLEWIDMYENDGYMFDGFAEIPISSLVLYSDETRWAKHVLLEGNNTLRMSVS